jgi:hypothetical protein
VKKPGEKKKPARPSGRRSACAEASLRAEIERLSRMTVEERITEALTMGRRFAGLKPTPVKD